MFTRPRRTWLSPLLILASGACGDAGNDMGGAPTQAEPAQSVVGDGADAGGPNSSLDEQSACEVHAVASGRVAPDILVVLDRSTSMRSAGVNRWTPSVRAITDVTASLADGARFGLMTFPGRAAREPAASCAPGIVDVPVGSGSAPAIATSLLLTNPNGATPTAASLTAAHRALAATDGEGDRYVLLVTDGMPNCTGGVFTNERDAQAVLDSVAAISAMNAEGIHTYVLGYGTARDADASAALDGMAVAGGTGDAHHRNIDDEAALMAQLASITGSTVRCDFALDSAVADPSFVRVRLGGQDVPLDGSQGWSLGDDRRSVKLNGALCDALRAGSAGELQVLVECAPVILR